MLRMERLNGESARAGPVERDIELAITALKKGAYLLKYGRRGKPKFCPFRLANDESMLVWLSGKEEKHLKLSYVSRIIPGQRTPIFQRYPRPEKEYQSFSLMYGERSLDIICKDKDEAEVWFTGIKALISRSYPNQKGSTITATCTARGDSRSDGFSSGANSPRTNTQRSSPLSSVFGSGDSLQKTPFESPHVGLEKAFPDAVLFCAPKAFIPSESASASISSSGSDGMNGRTKGCGGGGIGMADIYRVSLSSAVSSSSHGSGQDDGDALGDVFIWGEGTADGILGGGTHRVGSGSGIKMDSMVPRALESAVVLDVQNIACGGRHAALVTKQGEVFSWGEESGGCLGHGVDCDAAHPKLVDALKSTNVELVACGAHSTCAVSLSGDLYTWGQWCMGSEEYEANHWVPRRLGGPLEGIHVASISCGLWHTAVVTSAGQLFTFGDGTFGVLGHGDCRNVTVPREVESLKGLKTVRAACGFWHTASIVEVMVGSLSSSSSCTSSGKLFTWGDGDNYRLGHGDDEPRFVPTCVAALVEPNFCQVACGQNLTVALTTSGSVFTMGSSRFGQLGNPRSDGKLPSRVEGDLSRNFVEEIACGACHVAVLTSRTEVYTWGNGANGRLGHGDAEDRSSPAAVEALKDKQVKSVACGANFTVAICLHKWVSGADHSMCSGCRLLFNFKRKRHNCYNCGLVYCHSCSSKKTLRASLAPNQSKAYRVCDGCFEKLTKASDNDASHSSALSRRGSINQGLSELVVDKKIIEPRGNRPIECGGPSKRNIKKQEVGYSRVSPLPSTVSRGGNISRATAAAAPATSKKFFSVSLPGSRIVSRAASPTASRRPSPPRAATPTPTVSGLVSPDDAKRMSEDSLRHEVPRLRAQVESLTHRTQVQECELEKATAQLKEAILIAGEEAAKCKAAKEVIKSLTAQLKDIAERLPPARPCSNSFTAEPPSAGDERRMSSPTSCSSEAADPNPLVLSNGSGMLCHQAESGGVRSKGDEWVEQDEPGVYITFVSLPGGVKDLKRVRFSRKRFTEKQAEQWWAANRARVYQRYNVPMVDKSNIPLAREGLTAR